MAKPGGGQMLFLSLFTVAACEHSYGRVSQHSRRSHIPSKATDWNNHGKPAGHQVANMGLTSQPPPPSNVHEEVEETQGPACSQEEPKHVERELFG